MKIKVITRHAPSNYGSLLQAIATQVSIERLGHQCEIIDYLREDEHGLQGVLTSLRGKSWNSNLLKRIVYLLIRCPSAWLAERKFQEMRKHYLKLTKRYVTCGELALEVDGDRYMTGSDQVWGPVSDGYYDPAYFLSFVKEKNKKIAYAGSFGRTEFTDETLDAYSAMLSQYKYVTVRESSAVDLLVKMHVACEGQVLDPTLLLDASDWSQYIIKGGGKAAGYVLVYQIHNNPVLSDYAKRFAKAVGLPLVRVSPELYHVMRGGRFHLLPNVGEFLSYIKNASYIVTDSFHGTAFAINFNKQFLEVLPNNKTGSRNQSILQLTGLQDRVVTDFRDFSLAERSIDYAPVNEVLRRERKKSVELLKHIIED